MLEASLLLKCGCYQPIPSSAQAMSPGSTMFCSWPGPDSLLAPWGGVEALWLGELETEVSEPCSWPLRCFLFRRNWPRVQDFCRPSSEYLGRSGVWDAAALLCAF